MDLNIESFRGKRVHMIGIGGSSMSGLAGLLRQRGYLVSGSDNYDSYHVRAVRENGINVVIGHKPENVHGADLVIFSAAISPENPERREAERLGIPQMERSTLLGQLMRGYTQAVGVSGTHGKTTTTAMLSKILVDCGLDPAVHIGGDYDYIGGSTRLGAKNVFVAEACEFHSSFLEMHPTVAIVLNIQEDHLDYYKDLADIANAFRKFVGKVPPEGVFIGNGEDENVLAIMKDAACRGETFGFAENCDWRPHGLTLDGEGRPSFTLTFHGEPVCEMTLRVAGQFNIMNAMAAMAAAHALGADMQKAAAALSTFENVHRRFELTSVTDGVKVYHDYGHNPVEMAGALSVAKLQHANRIWAVMQPHTYSRVKRLFQDYIHCCDAADEILITDICAAREVDPGDINSQMLVDAIAATGQHVHLTPTFDDTERYLRAHWQPGDLVLTMGCGNINVLNEQIRQHGDTAK